MGGKIRFNLDNGRKNIGFKYSEAIMESVDDSFDAAFNLSAISTNRIDIYIYEDSYEEELDGKKVTSNRYSYLILDNGPGTKVDNIFNFGSDKKDRFTSKSALNSLNGIFHYGMSSHLNVGKRLCFYSREVNKEWWLNCIESSDLSDETYSYMKQENPLIILDGKELQLEAPEFTVRTIVEVKGVRKSEVEADNLNDLVQTLKRHFGITYRHYIERGNEININGLNVKPIDPLLIGIEFVENGIASDLLHEIEINLSELLKEEDEIVKQRITNKYGNLFNNEDELLKQTITLSMFHLNTKFRDHNQKKRIENEIPNALLPSPDYSGFYIKRNLRYIGRAAKILKLCTDHPQYNYFRAEISFSPIFDEFFGIQVNKNKYDIKNSLALLIKEKVTDKLGGSLSTFLKKYKKEPPIEIPIDYRLNILKQRLDKGILQLDAANAEALKIGLIDDALTDAKEAVGEVQKRKETISVLLTNFSKGTNITEELNAIEIDVNNLLEGIEQLLARIENAISMRNERLIEPALLLKDRAMKTLGPNRKVLVTKEIGSLIEFQGYMLEPLNEVQMYGLLYKFIQLYPDVFEFVLLDYSENKSLDCLVKIKTKEIYDKLHLKKRFENQWESEWDKYLLLGEGAFSFLELKYILGEKEDLGHSLALVSHLICWDFHENNQKEFNAIDGKYKLSSDKKYLFHKNKLKIVKVICLREMLEEILEAEFSPSKERLYAYLNR